MTLSQNLTLEEVTKSNTAEKRGINNTEMTDNILENLKAVAQHIFQPVRDALGPIRISSGYRSPALNQVIGGAKSSQHSKGEALDLQGIKCQNNSIFKHIKDNLDYDQLIWEFGSDENPDWVHVSFRKWGKNRNMILKSTKTNDKTVYSSM